jgi:RimJ/RimL family protein N-acetyltransferase
MANGGSWPRAEVIQTARLTLEPLSEAHAEEAFPLLNDHLLHRFTGGEPLPLQELRASFARKAAGGSRHGAQGWLNWIVRDRAAGRVVGTVQATLLAAKGSLQADVAWIIGTKYQCRGYATEAARGMLAWLREHDVALIAANIHPGHLASIRVARSIGLAPTAAVIDAETRWVVPASGSARAGSCDLLAAARGRRR